MFANGDAARRDMRVRRIERCPTADAAIKERCALNKVAESSPCKWMARFRKEDPDSFPYRSGEASSSRKVTRRGIADAMDIVVALVGGVAANLFFVLDVSE